MLIMSYFVIHKSIKIEKREALENPAALCKKYEIMKGAIMQELEAAAILNADRLLFLQIIS